MQSLSNLQIENVERREAHQKRNEAMEEEGEEV